MSSIELDLLPIKVLHCSNREFRAFCSCDLDLEPMTFIDKLDPYPPKMSPQTKNKHIRTDRCYQKHYRLLCFAGCNKYFITELETLAIANALQLEVARATPALSGFNYDAMLSLKSQNRRTLSYYSIFAADTLLCAVTLIFDLMTLNIALLVAFGSGMIFTKFDLRQLIRA